MITVEPTFRHGLAAWNQSLLPRDEYFARLQALQQTMSVAGLDAIVAFGEASDPASLGYFTGLLPMVGWSAAILHREHDPQVITQMGSRELPMLQSQSWVHDIRTSASYSSDPAEGVAAVLHEQVASIIRIGIADADLALDERSHGSLLRALDSFDVQDAGEMVGSLRRKKRPREQMVIRQAVKLARKAVAGAAKVYTEGGTNGEAALTASRIAQLGGAHDVRLLTNLFGESLSPLDDLSMPRRESFSLYCALEFCGYWGEDAVALPDEGAAVARSAVAAMAKSAREGACVADIADAGLAELSEEQRDIALSYGLGGGIGLSLGETPVVVSGSRERVESTEILSLRVVTRQDGKLVCAVQPVLVRPECAEEL